MQDKLEMCFIKYFVGLTFLVMALHQTPKVLSHETRSTGPGDIIHYHKIDQMPLHFDIHDHLFSNMPYIIPNSKQSLYTKYIFIVEPTHWDNPDYSKKPITL